MTREKDLYHIVAKALQHRFEPKGTCSIWVTADKIPEKAKKTMDTEAVFILLAEKKRPDLLGYVVEERPLPRVSKLVVDVKIGPLDFKDLYQIKLYADMLSPHYAFLISTEKFSEARRRFLQTHPHMIGFGKCGFRMHNRQITVMKLLKDGALEIDSEICRKNPFAIDYSSEWTL